MWRVGLTGGIASGKSAVAARLAQLGAIVIDADELAREVVAPGTPGLAAVVQRFGPGVLVGSELDRRKVGTMVFGDSAARADLEAIIHPLVRQRAADLEGRSPPDAIVVQVIPLLVETGQQDRFDEVVVVDIPEEIQLARLRERSGLSVAEAQARIAAQADRTTRLAAADTVLDNRGTLAELVDQVDAWWHHHRPEPPTRD